MARTKKTPQKIAKTPIAKKSPKKTPTGKKHGEIRKSNIHIVKTNIIKAINDSNIKGADSYVPKLLGLLKANQEIVELLLNKIQKQHIGNNIAEQLFFTSMKLDHSGKECLRRAMLKSKATDADDIDFLQHMFKIDSGFLTKVEPINTRKYVKKETPVTTPVESEEEEEQEEEPLPIKSPYQRKKEEEKAVRATSLKEIIEDLKNQIETITTKEIPALVEEKNKASKELTQAKKDWEEEYPRDAQPQDCTDAQYEKMKKTGTKKNRRKYFAKKKELENKTDDKLRLEEALKYKEDELLNNTEDAILENVESGSESDSGSDSDSGSSSSDESQSQTQLE